MTCGVRKKDYLLIVLISLMFPILTSAQANRAEKKYFEVIDSAMRYLSSRNEISYQFEETREGSNFKRPIVSIGQVKIVNLNGEIFYVGTHSYYFDSIRPSRYDFVKRDNLFGVNIFTKGHFKNYSNLKENKRYFGFNSSEKDLLKPHPAIYEDLIDAKYIRKFEVLDDKYQIELIDTNKHMLHGAVEGCRFNSVRIYHFDKKDYRLLLFSKQSTTRIEDLLVLDKAVRTYSFLALSRKEIIESIYTFTPMPDEPLPSKVPSIFDTLRVFPSTQLIDSSGKFTRLTNSLLLVDFWYKSCAPCIANMKYLERVKRNGLEIVLINVSDSPTDLQVKQLMKKYPFTFLFNGRDLATQLGITGYPTMFLLDEHQKIIYRHVGSGGSDELTDVLDAYLTRDHRND